MNPREQWLMGFAQQLGYATAKELQDAGETADASLEKYLGNCLSPRQMFNLRILLLEHCLLQAASQVGKISKAEADHLLKTKMATIKNGEEHPSFALLENNILPAPFVHQVVEKLCAQGVLLGEERQILTAILARQNQPPRQEERAVQAEDSGQTWASVQNIKQPDAPHIYNNEATINESYSFAPIPNQQDTAPTAPTASLAATTEATGQHIGPYKILKELGAGGMGKVYKAYHNQLDRVVAIKVMLAQGQISTKDRDRFIAEAKLTAKLHHPNIVAVHDVATEGASDYIVMEFIEGQSLATWMHKAKISVRKALETMQSVAQAIHYAHQNNVVHRDLKPGNIMIETKTGRAVVMDFGLAKNIKLDKDVTKSGEILGTPKYMAPEQARGEVRTISPRTDVYALGAILYELLCGTAAVDGLAPFNVICNVLNKEVIPLRKRNPRLAADLEVICHKALEKEQERRYQTAEAFAQDIERFLNGEALAARPSSLWHRFSKKIKHHRVATAMTLLVCLLLAFGTLWGWTIVQEQKQKALVNQQLAMAKDFHTLLLEDFRNSLHSEKLLTEGRANRYEVDTRQNPLTADSPHLESWAGYDEKNLGRWKEYQASLERHLGLIPKYQNMEKRFDFMSKELRWKFTQVMALRQEQQRFLHQLGNKELSARILPLLEKPPYSVTAYWVNKADLLCQEAEGLLEAYKSGAAPDKLEEAKWCVAYVLALNHQHEKGKTIAERLATIQESQYRSALELIVRMSPTEEAQQPIVQEAVDRLHRVCLANATFSPAYYQLGRLFHLSGRFAEAIRYYQKTCLRETNFLAVYYQNEILFHQWRELVRKISQEKQSARLLQDVSTAVKNLQELPKSEAAQEYKLYQRMNQFYLILFQKEGEMVARYSDRKRSLFTNFYICPYDLGHVVLQGVPNKQHRDHEQGLKIYQELLRILESFPPATPFLEQILLLKGQLYFDLGVLEQTPDGKNSYLEMALDSLHEAVRRQTFFPQAVLALAETCYFLGDYPTAEDHYRNYFRQITVKGDLKKNTPWEIPGYWKYIMCLMNQKKTRPAQEELEAYVAAWQHWKIAHNHQDPLPVYHLVRYYIFLTVLYLQNHQTDKFAQAAASLEWRKLGMVDPDIETLFYVILCTQMGEIEKAKTAFREIVQMRDSVRNLIKESQQLGILGKNLSLLLRSSGDPFMAKPSLRKLPPLVAAVKEKFFQLDGTDSIQFFAQLGNDPTFFQHFLEFTERESDLEKNFAAATREVAGGTLSLSLIFNLMARVNQEGAEKYLMTVHVLSSGRLNYWKAVACFRRSLEASEEKRAEWLRQSLTYILAALEHEPGQFQYHYAAAIVYAGLVPLDRSFQELAYFHLELALQNREEFLDDLIVDSSSRTNRQEVLKSYLLSDPVFKTFQDDRRFAKIIAIPIQPLYNVTWEEIHKRVQGWRQQKQETIAQSLLQAYKGSLERQWK